MLKLFDKYYDQYFDLVCFVALNILKNVEDATDVAQDVFLKLFYCLLRKDDIQNVKAWLYKTTKWRALSYRGKRATMCIEDIEELSSPDFSDQVIGKIDAQNAMEHLYAKNIIWFQIVEMRYFLHMSVEEMAGAMHCSTNAIRSNLYRAKRWLNSEEKKRRKSDEKIILLLYAVYIHEIMEHIKFMN